MKKPLSDEQVAVCFKLTKKEWKRWLEKNKGDVSVVLNHKKVDSPNVKGRSRFSRPALLLLKQLILSGKDPLDFYNEIKDNLDKYKSQLKVEDIQFLKKMENDWYKIHIPSIDLTEKYADTSFSTEEKIKRVIGSSNDPVVRHRLSLFNNRLDHLVKEHGKPDRVVIEFVREDFMGEESKKRLVSFQKERQNKYDNAKKKYEEFSYSDKKAPKQNHTS